MKTWLVVGALLAAGGFLAAGHAGCTAYTEEDFQRIAQRIAAAEAKAEDAARRVAEARDKAERDKALADWKEGIIEAAKAYGQKEAMQAANKGIDWLTPVISTFLAGVLGFSGGHFGGTRAARRNGVVQEAGLGGQQPTAGGGTVSP